MTGFAPGGASMSAGAGAQDVPAATSTTGATTDAADPRGTPVPTGAVQEPTSYTPMEPALPDGAPGGEPGGGGHPAAGAHAGSPQYPGGATTWTPAVDESIERQLPPIVPVLDPPPRVPPGMGARRGFGGIPPGQFRGVRPEDGAVLTAAEIVARTDQVVEAAVAAGAPGGVTDAGGGDAIYATLLQNLAVDAQGKTIFDHGIERVQREGRQVVADVRRTGGSAELYRRLALLSEELRMLQRAKRRSEDLIRVVTSLMLGVVPRALVASLEADGMGHQLEAIIRETIGTGRTLSAAAVRDLAALASYGVDVSVTPEHLTYRSISEHTRARRIAFEHGRSTSNAD